MTRWELHCLNWINCTRCDYANTRKKVVLGKGQLPCDIALIGEAPGLSENLIGVPFIGKAGKLLDRIVAKVFGPESSRRYTLAFSNVLGCIPLLEGHEKEEPDAECVIACKPRLEEFLDMAQPRLIIAVGKVSDDWLDQGYKECVKVKKGTPIVTIQHPSSILRMPFAAQSMAEHRCVSTISTALIDHLES